MIALPVLSGALFTVILSAPISPGAAMLRRLGALPEAPHAFAAAAAAASAARAPCPAAIGRTFHFAREDECVFVSQMHAALLMLWALDAVCQGAVVDGGVCALQGIASEGQGRGHAEEGAGGGAGVVTVAVMELVDSLIEDSGGAWDGRRANVCNKFRNEMNNCARPGKQTGNALMNGFTHQVLMDALLGKHQPTLPL
jgi:hypothetical protein